MHYLQQQKIEADKAHKAQAKANRQHSNTLKKEDEQRERKRKIKHSRQQYVEQHTEPKAEKFTIKKQAVKFASLQKNTPQKKFSIIRIKTHKTKTQATKAYKHIERLEDQAHQEHLKPNGLTINYLSFAAGPSSEPEEKKPTNPSQIISELQKQNRFVSYQADGGFSCIELLMSLSPDLFDSIKDEHKADFEKQFGADCARFIRQRFPDSRLCSIRLHLDEQTPHIQALVLPLTPAWKNSKSNKKGEREPLTNQDGKRVLTTSKRSVGLGKNAQELVKLHSDFANFLRKKGYDIERGEVSEPGAKTHQELREFKTKTQREFEKQSTFKKLAQPLARLGAEVSEALTKRKEQEAEAREQAKMKAAKKQAEKLEQDNKRLREELRQSQNSVEYKQMQAAKINAELEKSRAVNLKLKSIFEKIKAKDPQTLAAALAEEQQATSQEMQAEEQQQRKKHKLG